MDILKEFFANAADILGAATAHPSGILALAIMSFSFLAAYLAKDLSAGWRVLTLFLGVGACFGSGVYVINLLGGPGGPGSGSQPPHELFVTLTLPEGGRQPAELVAGIYQYNEIVGGQVETRTGPIADFVLGQGGWQAKLPSEVPLDKAVLLKFRDVNDDWWDVERFFPNHIRQPMSAGSPLQTVQSDQRWWNAGQVLLLAAEPAAERAAQPGAVLFDNYARRVEDKFGQPSFEWRIFVDEPLEILGTIERVDYELHPTFPNPFQFSTAPEAAFDLRGSGWGSFTILITVRLTDGSEVKTSHYLDLNKAWPETPPAPRLAPLLERPLRSTPEASAVSPDILTLTLDRIETLADGSFGTTGWLFEVAVNGEDVLHLPNFNYSDRAGRNLVDPRSYGATAGVSLPDTPQLRIAITGTRSSGGDVAEGSSVAPTTPGTFTIPVRKRDDENNGFFLFHFSVRQPD